MQIGINMGIPQAGGGLDIKTRLKSFGNLTIFKDFVNSQSTPNADYSIGTATATITAARDATHPSSYVTAAGLVVITTTANSARFQGGYYDRYGFTALKGLMVESASTNLVPASSSPAAASWTKTNITANDTDAGTTAPDGTGTCPSLTASAVNGTCLLAAAVTAQTFSVWMKRKTGTGNVSITADGGVTYVTFYVDSTWRRFSATATSASQTAGVKISENADAVYFWGAQFEDISYVSSYIPTTAGALGRIAETVSYPIASNRTAAIETIVMKFSPNWTSTLSTSARLMATDTKDRAIHFNATSDSFEAYTNKTDDATDLGSQAYKHTAYDIISLGTVIKHSSPYVNTFRNGVSEGTWTTNDFTDPAWGTNFYIGCDSAGANQLNGVIQSFAIYSDAKTSAGVLNISGILGLGLILPVNISVIQKFISSVQTSATRVRLLENARNYIIVRNKETSYVSQIAFTTVTNDNRNPPTTGFTDINPGEEWYETGSTNQVWFRPKVNGQSCTVEVETSVPRV